jgi:hypothetical protein
VASKKGIEIAVGTLVVPKLSTPVYLTPCDINLTLDMESWIEWSADQLGIVLGKTNDQNTLIIAAPRGVGTCFPEEVLELRQHGRC